VLKHINMRAPQCTHAPLRQGEYVGQSPWLARLVHFSHVLRRSSCERAAAAAAAGSIDAVSRKIGRDARARTGYGTACITLAAAVCVYQ